jgi:hypothetical protein
MRKNAVVTFGLGLGISLTAAVPATAQLWFFPDYAVPSSFGTPSTWFAASYARGINEEAGEADAVAAFLGRTGEKVSLAAGAGFGSPNGDREFTIGGAVGYDVLQSEVAVLSVQGGAAYMGPGDATFLRFPIGVALKTMLDAEGTRVTPWVMPRLNIIRFSSGGFSDTQANLGASCGVSFKNTEDRFGIDAALDALFWDRGEPITFGIRVHYTPDSR